MQSISRSSTLSGKFEFRLFVLLAQYLCFVAFSANLPLPLFQSRYFPTILLDLAISQNMFRSSWPGGLCGPPGWGLNQVGMWFFPVLWCFSCCNLLVFQFFNFSSVGALYTTFKTIPWDFVTKQVVRGPQPTRKVSPNGWVLTMIDL